MIVKARTIFVAVPLTAALTAATAVGIYETPWNELPGLFSGMVAAGSAPLVALGRHVTEPDVTDVSAVPDVHVADAPVTVLDITAVVDPADMPATEPVAVVNVPARTISHREPNEPNEPIDYAGLNTDVRLVTDTLERFNQKLLRMIAQAKSAADSSDRLNGGTTVALDAPVRPGGELKR